MSILADRVFSFFMMYRRLFLGFLLFFLGVSAGAIYLYQYRSAQAKEAQSMYEEALQQMVVFVQVVQDPQYALAREEEKVQNILEETISILHVLISEYSHTISGAMAGMLLLSMDIFVPHTFSYNKLANQDETITVLQKKHPKFWAAALSFVNGITAERAGNTNLAITYYQDAMKRDRDNYIADHAVVAVARNYEMIHNYEEAISWYSRIKNDYSHSLWLPMSLAKIYLLSNKS